MTVKRISLLIPCFNEETCINSLFNSLRQSCQSIEGITWTLLFINDGSTDNTKAVLHEQLLENADWCCGTIIDFSRNFGKEAALIAGLDACHTDACIIMDADLQDPPDVIPDLISKWLAGFQVVIAKRADRAMDSQTKRITASIFYKVFRKTSKLNVEVDASDFRLLDKAVVNAICNCREAVRFTKGFFAWAGFASETVYYNRSERISGNTKWKYWQLWNYALDGIFNFSTAPLRIWTYCGLLVTLLSFAFAARIIVATMAHGIDVPGYASLFVAVTFIGGIQLIGIGILGEYTGRIYMESKRRPLYLIRETIRVDARHEHDR